jgi:cystathionine beta-synthase
MVVILPNTGRNNMGKIYSDEWMRQNGFLERFPMQRVQDVVISPHREIPELITVSSKETVGRAIDLLQEYGISQMPVTDDGAAPKKLVGSIQERTLLDRVYRDPGLIETTVGAAMDGPFPTIRAGAHVDEAFNALLGGATALVVMDPAEKPVGIITRVDLLEFMAHTRAAR